MEREYGPPVALIKTGRRGVPTAVLATETRRTRRSTELAISWIVHTDREADSPAFGRH
jgi:hypothetical protein